MTRQAIIIEGDHAGLLVGLLTALNQRGVGVSRFGPALGEWDHPLDGHDLDGVGLVMTMMTGSEEEESLETLACRLASTNDVPLALFAHTFGAYRRPAFRPYAEVAALVFVCHPSEVADAQERFPNATVHALGNPLWDAFHHPRFTRAQVRDYLGAGDDWKVVLCCGTGFPPVDSVLFGAVADLAPEAYPGPGMVILAPGAADPISVEAWRFAGWSRWTTTVLTADKWSLTDILPGVDLVVDWATIGGVGAIWHRIPNISLATNAGLMSLRGIQDGVETWLPVQAGASTQCSLRGLPGTMATLLRGGELVNQLRRGQELFLPRPAEGSPTIAEQMARGIAEFIGA